MLPLPPPKTTVTQACVNHPDACMRHSNTTLLGVADDPLPSDSQLTSHIKHM